MASGKELDHGPARYGLVGPWASGPCEAWAFAAELAQRGSERDRRIAMLLVDNACEISLRTYLSMAPYERGGPEVSLKADPTFHQLLSGFDRCFGGWPEGVARGEIAWFHKLRNRLHHEGNGLTVDASKLAGYLVAVERLLRYLFGDEPVDKAAAAIGTSLPQAVRPEDRSALMQELDDLIARIDRRVEELGERPVAVPTADVVDVCDRVDRVVEAWYLDLSGAELEDAMEMMADCPFPDLDEDVLWDVSAVQEYLFFQRLFLAAAVT